MASATAFPISGHVGIAPTRGSKEAVFHASPSSEEELLRLLGYVDS